MMMMTSSGDLNQEQRTTNVARVPMEIGPEGIPWVGIKDRNSLYTEKQKHDYTEEQKVKLAVVEFTNYAIVWWHQLNLSRRRGRLPPISTWTKLKGLMRKQFVPNHYFWELYQKLQTLTQGNGSVDENLKVVEITMLQVDIQEDREATMARFWTGLRPKIAKWVKLEHYLKLDDLVDKVVKVEQRLKRRGQTRPSFNYLIPNRKGFTFQIWGVTLLMAQIRLA